MQGNPLKGQVLVFFALVSTVLLGLAALAVDAGGAWWLSRGESDALEQVKEEVMSLQNAIKFGSEGASAEKGYASVYTAMTIAKKSVMDNMPAQSNAHVEISVVEMPMAESGESDRYIGVEVTVEDKYTTTFAKTAGITEIPVSRKITFVVHPYSSKKVWREEGSEDGKRLLWRLRSSANGSTGGWEVTVKKQDFEASQSLTSAIKEAAGL